MGEQYAGLADDLTGRLNALERDRDTQGQIIGQLSENLNELEQKQSTHWRWDGERWLRQPPAGAEGDDD